MSAIDNAFDFVQSMDDLRFRIKDDAGLSYMIDNLKELAFFGEMEKNTVYLQMPIQIEKDGNVVYLTPEEVNEISLKKIKGQAYTSLHFQCNLDRKYIKVFQEWGANLDFSAKDNYGACFQKYTPKVMYQIPTNCVEYNIDKIADEELKELWEKLFAIFSQHKLSPIEIADLNKKIITEKTVIFGNSQKEALVDAPFQESEAPEYLKFSEIKYTKVQTPENAKKAFVRIGREIVNWDDPANYKQDFASLKDAKNTFYSMIKYYNTNQPDAHFGGEVTKVEELEKHYLSYMWPMTDNEEEAERLRNELTHYTVSATKFRDEMIFRLEVWERGIVYIITNNWLKINSYLDANQGLGGRV